MSDERLLPCPFCGGEAEIINEPAGYFTKRYVRCKYCSCRSAFTMYATTNVAVIKAWNTRKPMERIVERLEEQFKYNAEQAEIWRSGENVDAIMINRSEDYLDRANCYGKAIRIVKAMENYAQIF